MANPRGKRQAVPLPAEPMSIWDVLRHELGDPIPAERPEDSITMEELAEQQGISECRAGQVLRDLCNGPKPKLRKVAYRLPSGRRGICYMAA